MPNATGQSVCSANYLGKFGEVLQIADLFVVGKCNTEIVVGLEG